MSHLPFRVRKNSAGTTYIQPRMNFIEGSNVTLTVGEDTGTGEVDVTINSSDPSDTVVVRKNSGADVGTRGRLNFIEGTGVTMTIADDAGDGEIDITINSATNAIAVEDNDVSVGTKAILNFNDGTNTTAVATVDGTKIDVQFNATDTNTTDVVGKDNGSTIGTQDTLDFLDGTNTTATVLDTGTTLTVQYDATDTNTTDVVGKDNGSTIATRSIIDWKDGTNTTVAVVDNASALEVTVNATDTNTTELTCRRETDADQGPRSRISFKEGGSIAVTVADDAGDSEVDVTIDYTPKVQSSAASNVTVDADTDFVVFTTLHSAGNTVTLPAASGVKDGHTIIVRDGTFLANPDRKLTINRAGSDTISYASASPGTSIDLARPGGEVSLTLGTGTIWYARRNYETLPRAFETEGTDRGVSGSLRAWWPLGGQLVSGETIRDWKSGIALVVNGNFPWYSGGKIGMGLDFSTQDLYQNSPEWCVEGTSGATGQHQSFFISVWVNMDTQGTDMRLVGRSGANPEIGWELRYDNSGDQYAFGVSSDGTTAMTEITTTTGEGTGSWVHLLVGHDAGADEIYGWRNGVALTSATSFTGGINSSSAAFEIGSEGGAKQLDGKLEALGYFPTTKSIATLLLPYLYNGGLGTRYNP